jgi:hypothetical protein
MPDPLPIPEPRPVVPALSPLPPNKGVVILPPSAIRDSIKREVDKVLTQLPAGKGVVAEIAVTLEGGVNAAVAYRSQDDETWGQWQVGFYIGTEKSFRTNLQGGAYVRWMK